MESIAVKNVKDIQATGKHWLEGVLGQNLQENQQVFIMLFTPGVEPDEATRRQALDRIEKTWANVGKHMDEQGISPEEFDDGVDEAMEQTRRRES